MYHRDSYFYWETWWFRSWQLWSRHIQVITTYHQHRAVTSHQRSRYLSVSISDMNNKGSRLNWPCHIMFRTTSVMTGCAWLEKLWCHMRETNNKRLQPKLVRYHQQYPKLTKNQRIWWLLMVIAGKLAKPKNLLLVADHIPPLSTRMLWRWWWPTLVLVTSSRWRVPDRAWRGLSAAAQDGPLQCLDTRREYDL